ncbi:helix-turn-helix transcriptional regulator [Clostridium rectalis]|uniref:helix-turn-helix transcriptional regulator n=1 Tax=Clostridium rectalis TaxID=2040295 RepID=UPI000F643569|nr:helix-turn-helix domain-containing protein [Clostridium rectalis]
MAVKNRLKEIIDGKGIKQVWLAKHVGVNKSTISNIINNRYKTTIELGFKIADVLGVEFTDIFYYEKED